MQKRIWFARRKKRLYVLLPARSKYASKMADEFTSRWSEGYRYFWHPYECALSISFLVILKLRTRTSKLRKLKPSAWPRIHPNLPHLSKIPDELRSACAHFIFVLSTWSRKRPDPTIESTSSFIRNVWELRRRTCYFVIQLAMILSWRVLATFKPLHRWDFHNFRAHND